MYVSGCLGFDIAAGKLTEGGAAAQAELALNHLKNILLASNSEMDNVVKTTVFLQNFNDFQNVNEVYGKGMMCERYSTLYIWVLMHSFNI